MTRGEPLLAWASLRRPSFCPRLPVLLALVLCLIGAAHPAAAQPTPSFDDVKGQLDQVVGDRVEATASSAARFPRWPLRLGLQ